MQRMRPSGPFRFLRAPLRCQKGFSFVEVLIASTIFVMVLLGIYVVYETNQSTYVRGEADAKVQQNARVALDQINREILMAGDDPGDCKNSTDRTSLTRTRILSNPGLFSTGTRSVSNYAIQNLAASSVRFLADVNADSNVDGLSPQNLRHTEVVEFAYDGTNKRITRQVWVWSSSAADWTTGGAQAITENNTIDSLTFTYRDESNAVTANDYAVKRIEVSLTASVRAGTQGTQSYALNSDIRPRNL
jgi:prepilin-type N-terminal cleavage/methylation domain-containing protein